MKKCLPGVVCIENYTLFFMFACAMVLVYMFCVTRFGGSRRTDSASTTVDVVTVPSYQPNYPYEYPPRMGVGVLSDPYAPPLRDERYLTPINISTNIGAVDTDYRQIGILVPTGETQSILPLMGRPLFTNRNKWQYYTMSDQRNQIKLPVVKSGRSCTGEYGCDQIMTGDTVLVEGQKTLCKATLYDSDTIRYLPVI